MKENSIEEALEKLSTGKKIKMYELLRTFKREGIENFVITRKKYVDVILSDYKRVLKENEQLRTKVNSLKKKNEYYKECLEVVSKHLDNIDYDQILFAIYEYYISKQKVKDKIEEYKNILKTCNKAQYIDRIKAINDRVLELQELLESEE